VGRFALVVSLPLNEFRLYLDKSALMGQHLHLPAGILAMSLYRPKKPTWQGFWLAGATLGRR